VVDNTILPSYHHTSRSHVEIKEIVLKFCHVWFPQKMTLIFKIYFLGKINKSSYYEKGKKERKRECPPFSQITQPHPKNNSLEKKTLYPSQYQLIKIFYFSIKPHI
jgi:hypothetical protein